MNVTSTTADVNKLAPIASVDTPALALKNTDFVLMVKLAEQCVTLAKMLYQTKPA